MPCQVAWLLIRGVPLLLKIVIRSIKVAYRIPVFNLNVNIWRNSNVVGNPPDVTATCNLAAGERSQGLIPYTDQLNAAHQTAAYFRSAAIMTVLLPKRTDVRPPGMQFPGISGDLIEIPAGSGVYYVVLGVGDIGRGFQNEHRFAVVVMLTGAWMAITANPWNANFPPTPLP